MGTQASLGRLEPEESDGMNPEVCPPVYTLSILDSRALGTA